MVNSDDFLEYALKHGFGEIHCHVDSKTGMKAIVAIHSTKLGPALGGCRFISYPNTALALYDAMRLARGMSFKSALAQLPLGGGKAVIIRPEGPYQHEAYFHAFGKFVHSLHGQYITALDSGAQLSDMDIIAQHTPYIASLSNHGDPSPHTAQGVVHGIQAAIQFKLGQPSLQGLHFAIQGLGHVGMLIAQYLYEQGARLTVSDIDNKRAQHVATAYQATIVDPRQIHKIPCDAFVPCALGAILNDETISELQTSIVAGAANNQLAHTYHGQKLHDEGILYAPDYVINAGGVIFAAGQYFQSPAETVEQQIAGINQTLLKIFDRSLNENRPTSEIADIMALEKLA